MLFSSFLSAIIKCRKSTQKLPTTYLIELARTTPSLMKTLFWDFTAVKNHFCQSLQF